MLLLPDPFGPTITLTPGENSRLTRSGKDLKPFIVIDLRYMPLILLNLQGRRRLGRPASGEIPYLRLVEPGT